MTTGKRTFKTDSAIVSRDSRRLDTVRIAEPQTAPIIDNSDDPYDDDFSEPDYDSMSDAELDELYHYDAKQARELTA